MNEDDEIRELDFNSDEPIYDGYTEEEIIAMKQAEYNKGYAEGWADRGLHEKLNK